MGEKSFSSYASDIGLIPRIQREHKKLNKISYNLIKQKANETNKVLKKMKYKWPMKIFNVLRYQIHAK